MKENRSAQWVSLAAVLALTFLLVSVFVLSRSVLKFTGLQNVKQAGEHYYGINLDKSVNEIFSLSSRTGEGMFLRIDQISWSGLIAFPDLEVSENGEVYILREQYNNGQTGVVDVVKWDLEKNRLIHVADFPEEEHAERTLVDFQVRDGSFRLLFYTKGKTGKDAWNVYTLMPDGSCAASEYIGEDWDLSVTGVSLKSMPYPGVRLPLRVILPRILLAFLMALILELLAWSALQWWRTRKYRPGLLVYLTTGTAVFFLIISPIFFAAMRQYLYNYISRNEIYACVVESELYSRIMDRDVLDDLVSGRYNSETGKFSEMLDTEEGICAAVAWYTDDGLQMMGDLFDRGIYRSTMAEGSLKDCVDEVWGAEEPRGFLYAGRHGTHAMVMRPEKTPSGKDAVLCIQTPMRRVQQYFYRILVRVIGTFVSVALGVALTVFLVLFLRLAPLRRLQNAVADLTAGKLDTRVHVFGYNEVAAAAKEVKLMPQQLEKTREGAGIYRRYYEAFWPMDLMHEIAGKRFNASLKPGADLECPAFTLEWKPEGIGALSGEGKGELLAGSIDLIREHGGSPVRFSGEGLTAVFPGPAEEALICAVQMQQMLSDTGCAGRMGLASGTVQLRVVQIRDRRGVLVRTCEEAKALLRLAEIYKEGLITTASVYDAVAECGTEFHFRRLGKISVDDRVPQEELYELLDAETAERRRIREHSREQFEQGVSAYAAKDYFRARVAMIACLAADPQDLAARSYCINCDRKEPPVICQAE